MPILNRSKDRIELKKNPDSVRRDLIQKIYCKGVERTMAIGKGGLLQ